MGHLSPLRYPGGKSRFLPCIEAILEENSLVGCEYFEPYAGGASLALLLLENALVSRVHLNDLDQAIYAFWYSVLNHPEDLCDLVMNTELSVMEWNRQKTIYRNGHSKNCLLDLGFSVLYLNRTNHSGILNGGVIGGKEQSGAYRLDARFNRKALVGRIQAVFAMREQISLTNYDALDLMTEVKSLRDSFVYLDPPYTHAGKRLYLNHYKESDHQEVRNSVNELQGAWLVSYDYGEMILNIWRDLEIHSVEISHTARSYKVGREIMILKPGLLWPNSEMSGYRQISV